jgi:uncharacterized protein
MMMQPPEATLTITGEGQESRAPDEAKLSLQIITDDANATASTSKNNDIRNALKARLALLDTRNGEVMHETGYSVSFVPFPPKNLPPEQRQARYGYITLRTLSVTVPTVDQVGRVIDAASAVGVTDIGNVTFDLKDRHAAYLSALGAAMHDAAQQADALAAAGGFHITRIRAVTTGYAPAPQPGPMADMLQMRRMVSAPATPTEISPNGPIDITARVTVTYAIR